MGTGAVESSSENADDWRMFPMVSGCFTGCSIFYSNFIGQTLLRGETKANLSWLYSRFWSDCGHSIHFV